MTQATPARGGCCTFAAVDIPAILGEAWRLYTRFFARFVAVAGVVFIVLGGAFSAIEHSAAGGDATLVTSFAVFAVVNIGYVWVQGPLALLTHAARSGREAPPLGETMRRLRPNLRALLAAGALAGLGVALGTLFAIIPGVYLATRWSLLAPALVIEGLTVPESFRRSHRLITGRGFQVFGLLALLLGLTLVASVVIVEGLQLLGADLIGSWIGSAIVNTLITPYVAISTTLVYLTLSAARGADPARPARGALSRAGTGPSRRRRATSVTLRRASAGRRI